MFLLYNKHIIEVAKLQHLERSAGTGFTKLVCRSATCEEGFEAFGLKPGHRILNSTARDLQC